MDGVVEARPAYKTVGLVNDRGHGARRVGVYSQFRGTFAPKTS